MLPDILTTKVTVPNRNEFSVPRTRLLQSLRQNSRSLILISASAGYGKTSLIQQYLQSLKMRVAWVSLDEGDNDITRFWRYVIAAFQQQETTALAGLENLRPGNAAEIQDALALLINLIEAWGDKTTVLVLDDWHLIDNPVIEQALSFFVENLPQNLRLMISSRIDPDLPLSRLRAQRKLYEVREQDLRLSLEETAAFLREVDVTLTEAQLQALHTRTEGWIAGLQLVTLALQNTADVSHFVTEFTGTHRYIMDYLLDEVFYKQPVLIQDFLLSTAILRRMNASLCNAVCGIEDSAAIIENLEQNHLFVIALDDHKHWYRYHHLFADLLRQGLRQQSRLRMTDLHLRASRWYAELAHRTNDIDAVNEALMHAVEADNPDWLVELLNSAANRLWEQSQFDNLQEALNHVPADRLDVQPNLLVFRAWYDLMHGRYDRAQVAIETASRSAIDKIITGRLAVCRAFIATFQHRLQDTIREAQAALQVLPPYASWYVNAAIALGDAYAILGDPQKAENAYQMAIQNTESSHHHYSSLNAGFKLAGMQRQQGRLKEAFATCNHFIQQAETQHLSQSAVAGVVYALRGDIYTEWRQFAEAEADVLRGVEQNAHRSHIGFYGWANLYYVRYLIATGQYEAAEERLQMVTRETPLPPWLKMPYQLTQVIGWTASGNLHAAETWLQQLALDPDEKISPQLDGLYLTVARVLQLQERYEEAGNLLQRVAVALQPTHHQQSLIITCILQALNAYHQQDKLQALNTLTTALDLGVRGRYVQSFVSAGADLVPLLMEVRQNDVLPEYVTQILHAFPRRGQNLADPLSERELDVLRLIASGMKNQQIADELIISLNTVLYHTKNIYSKMNVSRRTQAIQKAHQLGLL